jgi:hypothetical protein
VKPPKNLASPLTLTVSSEPLSINTSIPKRPTFITESSMKKLPVLSMDMQKNLKDVTILLSWEGLVNKTKRNIKKNLKEQVLTLYMSMALLLILLTQQMLS